MRRRIRQKFRRSPRQSLRARPSRPHNQAGGGQDDRYEAQPHQHRRAEDAKDVLHIGGYAHQRRAKGIHEQATDDRFHRAEAIGNRQACRDMTAKTSEGPTDQSPASSGESLSTSCKYWFWNRKMPKMKNTPAKLTNKDALNAGDAEQVQINQRVFERPLAAYEKDAEHNARGHGQKSRQLDAIGRQLLQTKDHRKHRSK